MRRRGTQVEYCKQEIKPTVKYLIRKIDEIEQCGAPDRRTAVDFHDYVSNMHTRISLVDQRSRGRETGED